MNDREGGPSPLTARMRHLVSHDLKNPVSAAWTTAAFMAEMTDTSDPLTKRNISTMLSALGRALVWIDDFSAAVQLETGELQPDRSAVKVADALAELREALPASTAAGVELPDPLPEESVFVDRPLFLRALRAMFADASDRVSSHDRPVQLTVETQGKEVIIDCLDQGPPRTHWRADGTIPALSDELITSTPQPSVGMSLCRAFAAAHGGSLRTIRDGKGQNRLRLSLELAESQKARE